MNIFKVLASGKRSFQEETASAILAWFLNPTMEHGLGYAILSEFIAELSKSSQSTELSSLATKLIPRLRSESENQLELWCNLEYSVDTAFIDIVIGIADWIIAIENKIYAGSVSRGQLTREYEGIRKKNPNSKIAMVYLVPVEEDSDILDGNTEQEYDRLSPIAPDFKVLVTWQRNKLEKAPSISSILRKILNDEQKGNIDPVPEYTRHTLKALLSFISNGFSGYDYERKSQSSGINPLTEGRVKLDRITDRDIEYIGVQHGISGLLNMDIEVLRSFDFQYTSHDMSQKRNWIDVATFQKITSWLLNGEVSDIDWKGSLTSKLLYRIAKDFGSKVFIGIKGGENALKEMSIKEIGNRRWQISTEKATAQWIDGQLFYSILTNKQSS